VTDEAYFGPEGVEPGSEFEEVDPMEDATLAEALSGLADPLGEAERARDEYLAALQRLQADFENYRKRVARTADDVAGRIAADLVIKLLPVIDALDLAQSHFATAPESELDSLEAKALVQARSLLLDTLAREGLARIDEAGGTFDPQVHDAVAHVAGPPGVAEQVVDDVLRAGYTWKGAVLRPAMVRVRG
jgi:molecular chaperone GrpE